MTRISCDVTNCSHNDNQICYANIINVGGKSAKSDNDTCCASFLDSSNYSNLTSNTNQPGDPCYGITCNVNTCTYNANNICSAESIQVNGANVKLYTETNCKTFKSS